MNVWWNRSNRNWLIAGFISAFALSSLAAVPRSGTVSSMVAPQDVSEIRTKRQQELSFDEGVGRLSQVRGRYRENLPLMKRNLQRQQAMRATPSERRAAQRQMLRGKKHQAKKTRR